MKVERGQRDAASEAKPSLACEFELKRMEGRKSEERLT